jgi:hypothetical protein
MAWDATDGALVFASLVIVVVVVVVVVAHMVTIARCRASYIASLLFVWLL